MFDEYKSQLPDIDPDETAEWRQALDDMVRQDGPERAHYVLRALLGQARSLNVALPPLSQTPYVNTIPPLHEPVFPGDEMMEKRIRRIVRWNAMAMVTRANKKFPGLGGHLSSYASAATLMEVGFNHFFRGNDSPGGGDFVYFQGHSSPGVYARAFLEGRLTEEQLDHFRREVAGKGLSSYPHPWLMPHFWQFPTVSMGLGPLSAIYQARFLRYLHNRGFKDTTQNRVWAFLGDGECDEPETLGALSVGAREGLDNLTFVINCNLQRLDGPVRGNGKIIQELESVFKGAGWHVIKVIWGPEWDPLLAQDIDGALVQRMNATVDGEFQKFSVESGGYVRQNFFGKDPRLLKMVQHLPDEALEELRRGGHAPRKVYAAYAAAVAQKNAPTVILAKTVKGWTLGEGFEASNVTHQMKKMDMEQLRLFRDKLHLPIPDNQLAEAPYYHPGPESPEVQYLLERRRALGGFLPQRRSVKPVVQVESEEKVFGEFFVGSKAKVAVSTTMAFVRLLRNLMRDKGVGRSIVPIVPDEARTFGMDAFFREFGIYAALGQRYTPVDSEVYLNYHESKEGQILEEGITEAGSMASFLAAGTANANLGVTTIPFYIFYSMFGFQRTADQIWQFGDSRGRGFLLGATAGRTTLNGEGLQHEDGHSHLFAQAVPNLLAYDPTFAFETAVIVREGLRRMLNKNEDVFYYLTLYNENYEMPALPAASNVEEGILKGLYCYREAATGGHAAQIFASGPIMNCALEAQQILAERYAVAANVWSVTSYQQLYREARHVERFNRLHPQEPRQVPFVAQQLKEAQGPVVATSDWVAELAQLVSRYVPNRFLALGTNGFGRSDTREALRRHFEVDAASIVVTVLYGLMLEGVVASSVVSEAIAAFGLDPDGVDPMVA